MNGSSGLKARTTELKCCAVFEKLNFNRCGQERVPMLGFAKIQVKRFIPDAEGNNSVR